MSEKEKNRCPYCGLIDGVNCTVCYHKDVAQRWYSADGSYVVMPENEVVEKRKKAAKEIAILTKKVETLRGIIDGILKPLKHHHTGRAGIGTIVENAERRLKDVK